MYPVHVVDGGAIVYRAKPPEMVVVHGVKDPVEPDQERMPARKAW